MNFAYLIVSVLLVSAFNPGSSQSCNNLEHSTLCALNNGTKACCPLKDASCCAEGDFCCPKGFKCDLSSQQCISETHLIPFHVRMESLKLNNIGKDLLCPDNVTTCKEHQTCCLFENNEYGCCILKEAVCCDDHIHCCPKGYVCNPSQGKCDRAVSNNQNFLSVPWKPKVKGNKITDNLKNVPCPGGTSECPGGTTCCQLSTGDYGCCPLPNADCCSDHVHCCPNGYTCDLTDGKCTKGKLEFPLFKKTQAIKTVKDNVPCSDGTSECPSGSTCCQLSTGGFGCCPLPNADCCSDQIHCCPNGYKCDMEHEKCTLGDSFLPLLKKTPALKVKKDDNLEDVPCPGSSATCPSGSTCCQISPGEFGCCPLKDAVCCDDLVHCCPNGYKCDTEKGTCNKQDISIPFFKKQPAKNQEKQESVPCPGGSSECPSGSTCCQLSTGDYGCCPMPEATCCSDHVHCCPKDYTCDVEHQKCSQGHISIPFLRKFPSTKTQTNKQVKDDPVVCPGGSDECPAGFTCCQLDSGNYGCCPLKNAVCCSDGVHCCPSGYVCDVNDGSCNKAGISIPFFTKIDANKRQEKPIINLLNMILNEEFDETSIVCPDGSSFCSNGNTCCKLNDGSYGCCPIPNAVCCQDHLHCCPSGSHCNLEKQCCDPNDSNVLSIPLSEKVPAKLLYNKNEPQKKDDPVICPDQVTKCDPLKVCCSTGDGSYGCCPYSNGICCSQGHCCPNDLTCGSKFGECKKKSESWEDIKPIKEQMKGNSSCSNCGEGSVCCQNSKSEGLCCPYEEGTCCGADGYCCPKNYQCVADQQACQYIDPDSKKEAAKIVEFRIPHFRNVPSVGSESNDNSIQCPDTIHFCPDAYTCCMMKAPFSNELSYGCCPFKEAVCCMDGINCCPNGYKCTNSTLPGNTFSQGCYKSQLN